MEEGVGVALVADGGAGAVAGVDDGVVGELEEFGLDGIHDLIERAAPEIGAADAAGEERVSGEELRLGELDVAGIFGEIQGDATGRVAGSVNDIGLKTTPTERVAIFEELIDVDKFGSLHAEKIGLHIHPMVEGKIIIVHHDRRAGVLMELGKAADVINVGVGADDDFYCELVTAKKAEDALDLISGIDDDGFEGFGIADDQTIALENTDRQLDVDHLRVGGVGEMQGVGCGVHWEKYSIGDSGRELGVRSEGDQREVVKLKVKEFKSLRV